MSVKNFKYVCMFLNAYTFECMSALCMRILISMHLIMRVSVNLH